MAATAFRVFFGDRPATVEELARIEMITVEQEMDMAWEARLRMVLCLDDTGHWQNQPDSFAQPYSRVRVEIQNGEAGFVALIDGPVAGFNVEMSSDPGVSVANIIVRDDSVLLNRTEATEVFEDRPDSDLANEMFDRVPSISDRDVQVTTGTEPVTVKRGTPIKFLRELARAHDDYMAYVLPGGDVGQSVGCFRAPDTSDPDLPELRLLGAERNMLNATFEDDREGPENTRGRVLRISDRQIVGAERSAQDETLLGDLPQVSEDQGALRQLPPEDNTRLDPEGPVAAQNRRVSYSLKMSGEVIPGCYGAVLTPYRTVTIRLGTTPYSGVWLIHRVSHNISPSVYTQQIEAKRDALSDTGSTNLFATGVF